MVKPSIESRLRVPAAPSAEELRERIDAQKEPPAPVNPKLARSYTFPFKYATRTRTYEGEFTNHILSVAERFSQGTLFSDLIGGRPVASIPTNLVRSAMCVSWMTYSLERKGRPEWAQDLSKVDDDNVLFALFEEVWSHQTTFLGLEDDAKPAPKAT